MSKNGDAFLRASKELYLKKIHPFDFNLSSTEEYQRIIFLGNQLMQEIGLQDFLGYLLEGQYRVHVWAAYIGLEYGNPDRNEILKISGKKTIINSCIQLVQEITQRAPDDPIRRNQEEWLAKMKAKYSME